MIVDSTNRMLTFALLIATTLVLAACGSTEKPGDKGTVDSVMVTPETVTVEVGKTRQLTAEVSGTSDFSRDVTWSSSDATIATVSSNGLVTGSATGTATITAESSQNPSVKGTSTVMVIPPTSAACTDQSAVITFADEQVEAAVRDRYGLGTAGEILCSDVQKLIPSETNEYGQEINSVLYLSRCDDGADPIESLEGLQNLTSLLRLELACNGLTDLTPLSGMASLVELNLDENNISDLTPLAALTKLQVLGLYDNEVENLEPLSDLTDLRILYASDNRIGSVAALAGLTQLEQLWLFRNCRGDGDSDCLVDIGPLADLTNLNALLIDGNEVTSLAAVAGLSNLQFLNASGNEITDLSPLKDLANLQTVLLDMNPISSLAGLSDNLAFPAGDAPYGYQRGAVTLPLTGGEYTFNLQLGYNCLDVDSPPVAAQLVALAGRGAITVGADFMQLENEACFSGSSIKPFRAWWN